MAKIKPWSVRDDQMLRDLHAQGLPLNQISKLGKLKFSRSTIGAHAKKLGLNFDRSAMEPAIQSSKMDRAARRARILDRTYTFLEDTLNQAEQVEREGRYTALVPVGGGAQAEIDLRKVPANDRKNLAAAMTQAATSIKNLELIDGQSGLDDAKSTIGRIAAAIVQVGNKYGADGPPDDPRMAELSKTN